MPITPFHYPIALMLAKIHKRLILPALIVGSFLPDIEVLLLRIFFQGVLPDHLVLHSVIGALLIGTPLTMGITRYMYPGIAAKIFGVQKEELQTMCKFSWVLFWSCLVGNLGHILLDVTMHAVNPIFWPWIDPENVMGPLVTLFGGKQNIAQGFLVANITSNVVMGSICMVILLQKRERRCEYLLVGS